jgi:hypothetical protein
LAEGVASEPFLPLGDQGHKGGYAMHSGNANALFPQTCFQPLITVFSFCENNVFQSNEKTGGAKSHGGDSGGPSQSRDGGGTSTISFVGERGR